MCNVFSNDISARRNDLSFNRCFRKSVLKKSKIYLCMGSKKSMILEGDVKLGGGIVRGTQTSGYVLNERKTQHLNYKECVLSFYMKSAIQKSIWLPVLQGSDVQTNAIASLSNNISGSHRTPLSGICCSPIYFSYRISQGIKNDPPLSHTKIGFCYRPCV